TNCPAGGRPVPPHRRRVSRCQSGGSAARRTAATNARTAPAAASRTRAGLAEWQIPDGGPPRPPRSPPPGTPAAAPPPAARPPPPPRAGPLPRGRRLPLPPPPSPSPTPRWGAGEPPPAADPPQRLGVGRLGQARVEPVPPRPVCWAAGQQDHPHRPAAE